MPQWFPDSRQDGSLAWSRRMFLLGSGAAATAGWRAMAQQVLPKGGKDSSRLTTPACVLSSEQMEGPYYVDKRMVRRNITEGKPGIPLRLRIQVMDSVKCRPVESAALDIWHCDALGIYSGYVKNSMEAGPGGPGFGGPPPGGPPPPGFEIVADDSIANLRALMSLPTLESIFSQLAVEQDTEAISREIADLIAS